VSASRCPRGAVVGVGLRPVPLGLSRVPEPDHRAAYAACALKIKVRCGVPLESGGMASCCDPNGLTGMFDEKHARSKARRYRRDGLDAEARRIVEFLDERIAGRTVLEVGGGIGAIQLELLRRGASNAENVEISPGYEAVALDLATERGVADRIVRRVADFAVDNASASAADIVVLNRVVCCYPDMPALVGPAARLTKRWLVLTFPADRWWVRAGFRTVSAAQALLRSRFRVFFHEPRAIVAAATAAGLRPLATHRGLVWQFAALERA